MKIPKTKRAEIEQIFLNRKNWDKRTSIDGISEKLIYISAMSELRRVHINPDNTEAYILVGFYLLGKLIIFEEEWE